MSLGQPDYPKPPAIKPVPPLKVDTEASKAKIDLEERMRRATMSRQKSRLTKPYLKDIVKMNEISLSDRL